MLYIITKQGLYDVDNSIYYKIIDLKSEELHYFKMRVPYCQEFEEDPNDCDTAMSLTHLVNYLLRRKNEIKYKNLLELVYKEIYKDKNKVIEEIE